jgi:hypothetical protein
VALAAAFVGLASAPLCAQTVLASFDFEGVGNTVDSNAPAGFTNLGPTTFINPVNASGDLSNGTTSTTAGSVGYIVTGGDNTLKTASTALFSGSQALRIFDRNSGTTFAGLVSLRNTTAITNSPLSVLSFDFATTRHLTQTSNNSLFISFGTSGVDSRSASTTANYARIELRRAPGASGGTIVAASNSSVASGNITPTNLLTSAFTLNLEHNLKIVVNDAESARTYTIGSVERTINANTYDVWLNGTRINTSVGASGLAMRSTGEGITSSFAHFSFGTGTDTGINSDWVIDNISVTGISAIPEPSTFASLAGLGSLGMVALRRRRRVA